MYRYRFTNWGAIISLTFFSCFITGKPRIIYRALGSNIVNTVPLSELFSAVMVPL